MKNKFAESDRSTNDSLLDIYTQRENFSDQVPMIMAYNLAQFVQTLKLRGNKLEKQSDNVAAKFFPTYSSNPNGENFDLYCKYQLLTYKPWQLNTDNAWDNAESIPSTFIMKWKDFLQTPYAEQHVPCCLSKLNDVELLAECEENSDIGEHSQETGVYREHWMVLSSRDNFNSSVSVPASVTAPAWSESRYHHSDQQSGEMAN